MYGDSVLKKIFYLALSIIIFLTYSGCTNKELEDREVPPRPLKSFTEFYKKSLGKIQSNNITINNAQIYLNSLGDIAYLQAGIWSLIKQENKNNYYDSAILSCGSTMKNIETFQAENHSIEYRVIEKPVLATECSNEPYWVSLQEFTEIIDEISLKDFVNEYDTGNPSFYDIQFYPAEESVYSMIGNKDANTKFYSYSDGEIKTTAKPDRIELGLSGIGANQIMLAIIPYYDEQTSPFGVNTIELGQDAKKYNANNLMVLVIDRK